MVAPSALVLKCELCGAEAPHRVLRGKIGGKDEIVFEGTVKCPNCGRVSTVVTREPKPIQIPLVVSWLDKSERTSLEFSPEENVAVGEELDLADSRIEVTAVEAQGRRVAAARAKEVATVWAKRIDRVRVKFSVNKGNRGPGPCGRHRPDVRAHRARAVFPVIQGTPPRRSKALSSAVGWSLSQ